MKKIIAFFVDKELGISLALSVIRYKSSRKNKIVVFCRKKNRKYFVNKNAVIANREKDVFKLNPDIIFSINYWKRIKKVYAEKFKIINLHHSYNLIYRGRHTCSWAIMNARKHNRWIHGTTLHVIDGKIDRGKIICSYTCPIFEDDTAYILFLRVEKLAKRMFKKYFPKILKGDFKFKKPAEINFYHKRSSLNHRIDLNQPVIDIYDQVRALTFPKKPLPFTVINGKVIKLKWGDNSHIDTD